MTKPTEYMPRHLPCLVSVFPILVKMAWVLNHPVSAQSELMDAQADLSLCWRHTPNGGFVMLVLNLKKKGSGFDVCNIQ